MSEHVLSILVKALGLGQTSAQMKSLDHAIGSVSKTAEKGHAALSHFGGRIGQLAGAAGLVGVTGAAFGFAGALEQGIAKVDEMGKSVEKLSGVTGLSAHSASQLLAVFEKFGVDGDAATRTAGFAEKTLGKLANTFGKTTKATKSAALANLELRKAQRQANGESVTAIDKLITEQKARDKLNASMVGGAKATSKLVEFDKKYGLSLVDAKGKTVDYATEINQVADFYQTNASAATKALVASTLFGKSYVQLIPILKLGSKGIAEAAAEADKLGLTLKSAEDVKNVHDFIDAQRTAKDAIAGLEVQLGLIAMPDLTVALKGLVSFLGSHHAEVQDFFRQGLKVAEGLAAFVTGTLIPAAGSVAAAFSGAWNAIPAPLRDMIVKGTIADRTVKFLFGFSPIHTILDIGGSLLAKGLSAGLSGLIGKNIVQPVFVTNQVPGGGGLPGVGGAAAGEAGAGAAGLGLGTILLGLGADAVVASAGLLALNEVAKTGTTEISRAANQATVNAAEAFKHNYGKPMPVAVVNAPATSRAPGSILDRGGREKGFDTLAGKIIDDKVAVTNAIKAFQASLTPIQRNAVSVMNRMLGSTGSVSDKIAYLNRLQARFAARGDTTLQNVVKGKISALQAAETARLNAVRDKVEANRAATVLAGNKVSGTARKAGEVAKSGGDHAAAAIARKKMSVTVPVSVSWVTQLKLNGTQIAREDNRRSRIFAIHI